MGYNLLINGIYWGYNPLTNHLLTSWDILVMHIDKATPRVVFTEIPSFFLKQNYIQLPF